MDVKPGTVRVKPEVNHGSLVRKFKKLSSTDDAGWSSGSSPGP